MNISHLADRLDQLRAKRIPQKEFAVAIGINALYIRICVAMSRSGVPTGMATVVFRKQIQPDKVRYSSQRSLRFLLSIK